MRAVAAQRHIVRIHGIVHPVGQPLDRALELAVLERGHLAAGLADEMVVMVAARVDRLIARHALGHVHAPREVQAVEQIERAVDGRHADVAAALVQAVGDLLCRDAAAQVGQALDDRRARSAQSVAIGSMVTRACSIQSTASSIGSGRRWTRLTVQGAPAGCR